eukprot:CAMPEP_0168769256 /NCGR_PEP_ID=MMETSP0725-20121227/2305_1 /TAXON_ID=265536 /ORGANISM="Amphiprora sp., Strain CCMP467" /LENGTH=288 /DNA_ID=CAMNT_0008818653 /DNA_START=107 /DNA_END=973 /DNA_ORIENTATION=-
MSAMNELLSSSSSSFSPSSPFGLASKLRRAKRRLFLEAAMDNAVPSQKSLMDEEESSMSSMEYSEDRQDILCSPSPFSTEAALQMPPPLVRHSTPEFRPSTDSMDGLKASLFLPSLDDEEEEDMDEEREPQEDHLIGLTLQPRPWSLSSMDEDAGLFDDIMVNHGALPPHVHRPAPMHHDEIEGEFATLTLDVPEDQQDHQGAIFSPRSRLPMADVEMDGLLTLHRCNAFEEVARQQPQPEQQQQPSNSVVAVLPTTKKQQQGLDDEATKWKQVPPRRTSNKRVAAAA